MADTVLGGGDRAAGERSDDLRPAAAQAWAAAPFLAIAAVCSIGAFVGLDASSYWIDELFSLFVSDHGLGQGEVLARALTDTHPPGYYFILHAWIEAFGSSETATRALSALFATATLPVLFVALRGSLTFAGRSFAVALGAASHLFIITSQAARNYSLATLLTAGLLGLALALQRRLRGEGAPVWMWWALFGLGAVAEFVHFYSFLIVGMIHLYLLLQARRRSDRLRVIISGAVLAALMSVYVVALLDQSRQDLQDMWFSNSWAQLGKEAWRGLAAAWSGPGLLAVLLLILAPWADRLRPANDQPAAAPPQVSLAPLQLSLLGILGVVVSGLVVSFLVAPSFGTRNLYVLAPFFWAIGGWLFDAAGPDLSRRSGRIFFVLLAVLLAIAALPVRARLLPQIEEWRASAAKVAAQPGCEGHTIPAVLPFVFGPSTPFFRKLAEERFFGRYFPEHGRLKAYTPKEFARATADPALAELLRARARGGCRILAWGVHDIDGFVALRLQRDIAETAGLPSVRVRIVETRNYRVGMFGDARTKNHAYIFERVDAR